jgi:hypothetical protein
VMTLLTSMYSVVALWTLLVAGTSSLSIDSVAVHDFQKVRNSLDRPLLIEQALPVEECRQWWKHIQVRSKDELVRLERQATGSHHEQTLLHALETVSSSQPTESIYITSSGSSCSTDQLPAYDFHQSFFEDPDSLPYFSVYTPLYDTLIVSGPGALSTLSCYSITGLNTCLSGGSLEWRFLPQIEETKDVLHAYETITRTWEGYGFSLGGQSQTNLFDKRFDESVITASSNPGDLVIIPPDWWFQTRSLHRLSVSIQSKRCGSSELPLLASRLLTPVERQVFDGRDKNAQDIIRALFDAIEKR